MIDAYIIQMDFTLQETPNDPEVKSVQKLYDSVRDTQSEVNLVLFNATVPSTIDHDLDTGFRNFDSSNYKWNWPEVPMMDGLDMKSGLYKKCYRANDQRKVEACLISHMRLWDRCVTLDQPIIILESDAQFIRKFDLKEVQGTTICGLNDPRGTTRRSAVFHEKASANKGTQMVPTVNRIGENPVPQGLAGNSAYYITPEGAKKLLDLVTQFGGWPNDAIMCKELIPSLRVVYPYFTKVQRTASTTTG